MTDSIEHQIDFGTKERQRRGNLRMEPRDVSNGGNIITTGLTETITSTLDYLRQGVGYLGSSERTEARYGAGIRLWCLFAQFGDTQPTKDIGSPGRGAPGEKPVMLGDIGDSADIAESIYHAVMTRLAMRQRIIRVICIDGCLNWPCPVNTDARYLEQLCDALDLLESILEKTEGEFEK